MHGKKSHSINFKFWKQNKLTTTFNFKEFLILSVLNNNSYLNHRAIHAEREFYLNQLESFLNNNTIKINFENNVNSDFLKNI